MMADVNSFLLVIIAVEIALVYVKIGKKQA